MGKRRKSGGSNRVVAQLSDENYLALNAAITPPGELAPTFGAISLFFNRLMDDWRVREAMKESPVITGSGELQ